MQEASEVVQMDVSMLQKVSTGFTGTVDARQQQVCVERQQDYSSNHLARCQPAGYPELISNSSPKREIRKFIV